METAIKLSVVTPSFNQARFIERTLESVRRQATSFAFEHIVVDGGSTDGTPEILEQHKDHIRFVSEPDRGMPDAVNKGIAMARGGIIGWLNSDDLYLPGALQKAADFFYRNPATGWVYGQCRMVDDQDREVRKWITAYKNRGLRNYSYERLLVENFISQPAVFMRREALAAAGPLDLTLPTAMDFDLWLRLGKGGAPGVIHDYLSAFRVHPDSISARGFREQFEEQYRVHLRYDQTPSLLRNHRLRILGIVTAYRILGLLSR